MRAIAALEPGLPDGLKGHAKRPCHVVVIHLGAKPVRRLPEVQVYVPIDGAFWYM